MLDERITWREKMKKQTNDFNFHYPFDSKDSFGLFMSYCFWIVNILFIIMVVAMVGFMDLGYEFPQEAKTIGSYGVLLNGFFVVFRLVGAFVEEYKLSKEELSKKGKNE